MKTGLGWWNWIGAAGFFLVLPILTNAADAATLGISSTNQGAMHLEIGGNVGQSAVLFSSPDLSSNSWTTLENSVVWTDGVAAFDDFNATNSQRFYRAAISNTPTFSFSVTGDEDQLFPIGLDSANPSSSVAPFIVQLPARGQLFQFGGDAITNTPVQVIDSGHRVQFRGGQDENGTNYAQFSFMRQNADGSREAGQVMLNVNPGPSTTFDTLTTLENTPIIFTIPITDPDPADQVQIRVVIPPPCVDDTSPDCLGHLYQVNEDGVTPGAVINPGDTVSNSQNLLMFSPDLDRNGATVMVFQLEDQYGFVGPEQSILITVQPVNQPPVAVSHEFAVPNTDAFFVTAPDVSDVDGDALQVRLTSLPAAGQLFVDLEGSGGPVAANTNDWLSLSDISSWQYELPVPADCNAPIPTGTNIANWTFIAQDPGGLTSTARYQIDILDVNVPPTGNPPAAVTNQVDQTFEMATNNPITIPISDRDGGGIIFIIDQIPQHGTLYYFNRDFSVASVDSDNWQVLDSFKPGEVPTFFYVPDPGFTTDNGAAPDSFSFELEEFDDPNLITWRCQPTVLIYVQ